MYVSWKERAREECEETKEERKKGRKRCGILSEY